MHLDVGELLQFCAYYQLNKHASSLTVETVFQDNIKPSVVKQKPEKVVKRKIQVVEPKKSQKPEKVIKPKMQIAPRRDKVQIPLNIKASKTNEGQDLNYFMSHMSGKNQDRNFGLHQEGWNNPLSELYSKPYGQSTIKNYDTFGRSNHKNQYQPYQSKTQKQNSYYSKLNFTERPPQYKSYALKSAQFTETRNAYSPIENYQTSRIKQFWETPVYQTRKNGQYDLGNMMYSPVKRQNPSPTHSLIFTEQRDRSLSKSRSQQKRKNSQRPFYNASQLLPKERENDARFKKNEQDLPVLSNSFMSIEQRSTINKKPYDDDGRRQTSVTAAPNGGKANPRRQMQSELDDGFGDIIQHLATEQRSPPIAISMLSRDVK